MIRSLVALLALALTTVVTHAQSDQAAGQLLSTVHQSAPEFPDKTELLRRVAVYEDAARKAPAAHATHESLVEIYVNLGALYEDLGMYFKAEDAIRRSISLLQDGPKDQLAEELGHLGLLHAVMGNMKQAEKDDLQSLRVREALGDPIGIAFTWNDLADLYDKQRQFMKALDYAQKSFDVIGNNPAINPSDRVAVHQTLALAFGGLKQCAQAIPLLEESVEISSASFGADNLLAGVDQYLLGSAYWHCGDMNRASELMERGIARMKITLGWGHVIYVSALEQYAQFLRQYGRMEAARSAESEVHQAQSLVDARTFTH